MPKNLDPRPFYNSQVDIIPPNISKIGANTLLMRKDNSIEIGSIQSRPVEIGALQMRPAEIRTLKPRITEICTFKLYIDEIGSLQIRLTEIRAI
jgi:hypothetical protein